MNAHTNRQASSTASDPGPGGRSGGDAVLPDRMAWVSPSLAVLAADDVAFGAGPLDDGDNLSS